MPDRDTSNATDAGSKPAQATSQPAARTTPAVTGESPAAEVSPSAASAPHSAAGAAPAAQVQAAAAPAESGTDRQAPEQEPATVVKKDARESSADTTVPATPGQTPAADTQQSADQGSADTAQKDSAPATKPRPNVRSSASRTAVRQPTKRKKERKWPRIVALVLLIAVVSIASLAAWQYWLRFDDKADIQGTWAMQGATEKISITENDIVLSPDVSYGYSIDAGAKTITYTFGNLSGSGTYHFADNRNTVIIRESGPVDIGVALGLADDPALLATDNLENGIIVLHRAS